MKKMFAVFGGLVVVVVIVVLVRTLLFTAQEVNSPEQVSLSVDANRITQHMVEAIRFKTISVAIEQTPDYLPFENFVTWVVQTYPEVQAELSLEMVADYTMLYRWQGSNTDLQPVLLTSHYDVVPVVPGSETDWQHPPFAGDVADGYIWGRGALDDKSAVVVMLEAMTMLLQEGTQPERTIYFSFSHDEERGGIQGAAAVTALLKSRGVQLAWSLDEGSFIISGFVPGIDKPVAMINVAEKGGLTLDLVAHGPGGHSSMPKPEVAIDILAQALVKLRQHPVPGGLDGLSGEMFTGFARHGDFTYRLLFANQWLFGGLIERQLAGGGMDAMLRTTTAPTILRSGVKTNVIPPTATASVNFRLHPRDTFKSVRDHVVAAIADERVEVVMQQAHQRPASQVSSTDSDGYRLIENTVRQYFGDVVVVPGLLPAGTDTLHYSKIADNSYRFQFLEIASEDMSGFHGTNERVSTASLAKATAGYYLLLKQAVLE